MTEREKAVVGVKNALKITAFKVKADDMTCDLITCDSTPSATIPAHIPRSCPPCISNPKQFNAIRMSISIICDGKIVVELDQS